MKINFNTGLFVAMVFITISCIEPYMPQIDKYESLLVVDGGIHDQPGPYTVKLSFSSPIDTAIFKPYSNCQVIIIEKDGASAILQETEPGIYQTNDGDLQGVAGKYYKLRVHTPDETIYESDFEELLAAEKIDKVYAVVENKEVQGSLHDLEGYQFYVDTKQAESDTNYYLWRLEATYHYQSDFTIRWIFDGELDWSYNPDTLFNCWNTYFVDEFYTMSTAELQMPKIEAFPLNYVDTDTRRLSVRYSLFVSQFTMNRSAFDFWDALREQHESQGAIYASQPYQVRGNIHNTLDANEPVLGYFMVAGLDEQRIFVDRPLFPVKFYYPICDIDAADYEAYGQMWMADPVTYPIFAIETNGGRRAVPPVGCVDCRTRGGTITKPDFWID